ncbi:MAG: HAD-IIA family hydrolase [Chloroflexi bacterium]|nr:HAD-IIA family hydrolase [Chloroflexota bacterium]
MNPPVWLSRIRAVLLDVDGVLYRGQTILPGAREFMACLQARGMPFAYVTNNSTLTAQAYAARLQERGFPASPQQVIGSSEATAYILQQRFPQRPPVLAVGESGVIETLRAYGFPLTDRAEEAQVVVAGMDRGITYGKLAEATYAIRGGAAFYGTNPDRTYPTERGLAPGAGSILAALTAATDQEPVVVGKPEAPIFRLALERVRATPDEVVMIGDRVDTDVEGAKRLGMRAILVLTGVTSAPPPPGPHAPDLVIPDLRSLLPWFCPPADTSR